MRKIILAACLFVLSLKQVFAQQKWDKPMQLKSCSIDINCDAFTATTFIEMEFYNPNNSEIEGLHRFELLPGQVITAFQLNLNGKYRDGSIEEKWKATNAYNTIVGKRIDPALLTMEHANHYSLRIYPLAPKGCRKVTMTIQQLLTVAKNELLYSLPLNLKDIVEVFSLGIKIANNEKPLTKPGLIVGKQFVNENKQHRLEWITENTSLITPISFAIPIQPGPLFCTKTTGPTTHFALRFHPSVEEEYEIHPRQITVFWDASASGPDRDINREINFLKQFIAWHKISQLTIILFNYKLLDTATFYTGNGFNSRWQHYLKNINYDGSTQLGIIDVSGFRADMFMVFTDGKNTFGKSKPKTGAGLVYCVHSSATANIESLGLITGSSGGKIIDLSKANMSAALASVSRAENRLMKISSANGKLISEQALPLKWAGPMLINGTTEPEDDTIFFHYGNNSGIKYIEKIAVGPGNECPVSCIDRITMLNNFERNIKAYSWNKMVDFGLQEKVVTPNTAYIVLERTEDYVKYNIAPPADLEEECEKLNYVKRDTRFERLKLEDADEFGILTGVVNAYNQKIRKWDETATPIFINRVAHDKPDAMIRAGDKSFNSQLSVVDGISGQIAGLQVTNNSLEEVVVVGYGYARKNNLTGAVINIRTIDIFSSAETVEQALQGRVAGLHVTGSNGSPGSPASISIRGMSSLNGNTQPLYVLDGMPVPGNVNDMVNVRDIDHITVLKGVSASALYGSRAANGAIVIVTKKRKNYYNNYDNKPYRLKDMDDVEYLQELKNVTASDKMVTYGMLKEEYGGEALFYFDAAQHMFESGFRTQAFEILMNATEVSNGNQQVLLATAYFLESWRYFKEAINIYEELLASNMFNLNYYRSLAWAHYQMKNYQQAVDVLYSAIKINMGQQEYLNQSVKALILSELNAIISMHNPTLDISRIPPGLLRSLPADMRIIIDCNATQPRNISIREPGGETCSFYKPVTKNGGTLSTGFWQHKPPVEYYVKKAPAGKYRISVNYYDYYTGNIPSFIRIVEFKNFGKENQIIEVENVIMNNQNGEIEIAELDW